MDEKDLKQMVLQIIGEMTGGDASAVGETLKAAPNRTVPGAARASAAREADTGEAISDITKIDLRRLYLVEHPKDKEGFLEYKLKTPARLGVGRAGARYKTLTQLRVRADHAAAQDAVFTDVSEDFVAQQGYVAVQTVCKDKDEYLTRPDLGRQFSDKELAVIKDTFGTNAKVVLVVGDGLSSAAIEANAADIVPAIRQGLKTFGIEIGKILFVKFCRVGALETIGELTGADVVCMLIGERPGLVTAESMSCYMTYKPRLDTPIAKRTVISNIHSGGTVAVEAGAHIAELIKMMLDKKASGVDLIR